MKPTLTLTAALLIAATAALAHSGVKNPAVKARMAAMSAIGDATKILGQMAKGQTAFDAATARAAAQTIAEHAATTPDLFEAPETDPKSEALPVIWTKYEDFTAKALELHKVAEGLAETIQTPEDLRAGLGQLGGACKSCHSVYRQ
ncbi:MAG: c-type cytochrome [Marinibacterium sp.]